MRYRCVSSYQDQTIHIIYRENERLHDLPTPVLWMGPFTDPKEGDIVRLKPHYRMMLAEQGFVVAHHIAATFTPEID
jgi:hypothetical protein